VVRAPTAGRLAYPERLAEQIDRLYRAAWEAEESALERGDLEGAVAAVLEPAHSPMPHPVFVTASPRCIGARSSCGRVATMKPPPTTRWNPTRQPSRGGTSRPSLPSGSSTCRFHRGDEVLVKELPRARLIVIPDAGHLAPLEQPERFRRFVLDHLRES
jgi:pimeloyl-ACP methyl ester carboxylesterase